MVNRVFALLLNRDPAAVATTERPLVLDPTFRPNPLTPALQRVHEAMGLGGALDAGTMVFAESWGRLLYESVDLGPTVHEVFGDQVVLPAEELRITVGPAPLQQVMQSTIDLVSRDDTAHQELFEPSNYPELKGLAIELWRQPASKVGRFSGILLGWLSTVEGTSG